MRRKVAGRWADGHGRAMLDCFVNLLGPVRRVTAQLLVWQAPPEASDSLSVLLEFANGMSGTLATVRVTPVTWRLHLFGTAGNARTIMTRPSWPCG